MTTNVTVSVFMAMSLDGFIARPDGDVGWLHELPPLEDGDDAGYSEFFSKIDALVMGRGTFEKVLTFDPWPYGEKPVIVMSNALKQVPDELTKTVRIETGTPQDVLQRLSDNGYEHLYLDGGKLIQSFLAAGLVDDMTLTTIPILIGTGLSLFGTLEHDIKLTLLRSKSWNNGMVQSTYRIVK